MKPSTLLQYTLLLLSTGSSTTVLSSPAPLPDAKFKDPTLSPSSTTLMLKRDNCHTGELKVYRTGDSFLCVGTTVFWAGLAIGSLSVVVAGNAAQQFATWVINKFQGAPTATESGKRLMLMGRDDGSASGSAFDENTVVYDEDEEIVTYFWAPTSPPPPPPPVAGGSVATRDVMNYTRGGDLGGGLYIHNMTKQYNKTTGGLVQADMVFDGPFGPPPPVMPVPLPTANSSETSSGLAKRSTATIQITYWAESGHQTTSLDYDSVENLYRETFFHAQPGAGSECGYAANSGTWHGAWKVTVQGCRDAGECSVERSY